MTQQWISDLARATGFSRPTIRYYERVGLLPEPDRTAAGYRVYGDEAVARLRFVARAKRLGLSLEEIKALLVHWSDGDCLTTRDHLQRVLLEKIGELRRTVEELQAFGDQLEASYERLTGHGPRDHCGPDCGCPPDVRHVPSRA